MSKIVEAQGKKLASPTRGQLNFFNLRNFSNYFSGVVYNPPVSF